MANGPDKPRWRIQFLEVFNRDAALFKKFPMLFAAAVIIILVPTIYTTVYVESIWDPYKNLSDFPAGLVTLDKGMKFKGKSYNIGSLIVDKLKKEKPFDFTIYSNEKDAEKAVRLGDVYFSLVIPADFSRNVIPGTDIGRLMLYTSCGRNYIGSTIAEKLAQGVTDRLNHILGLERWKAVLDIESVIPFMVGRKTAEDLTASVTFDKSNVDPVSVTGPSFAPYFMALSLWVGVLVASFLFHPVVFPESLRGGRKIAKILGKWMVPFLITLISAFVLGLFIHFGSSVPVLDEFGYYLVLLFSVFTYTAIILSLNSVLGDAGKLICIVFLIIQLAAAGGIYPINLEPHIYQAISPYLPLTNAMEGLRAAMFGSFGGDWLRYVLRMLPWIFIGLGFSFFAVRRFKYVKDDEYGPAVDLPFTNKES